MQKTILFLAVLLLLLTGCSQGTNSYQTIDMEEVKQMLAKNDELIVLDVRTEEEYNEGHIPNALLYPVQDIQSRLQELDKSKKYIVVCRSGNRSQTASDILVNNGFRHVYNTSGGMNQWTGQIVR